MSFGESRSREKQIPSATRIVAYAGSRFTVSFARTMNGSPGYGEKGRISNREHFKKIEETEFFEFKSFQIRMPCYYLPGRLMVITHGFIKKTGPIPQSELDIAERVKRQDTAFTTKHEDKTPPWKN
jgi:hypothetical protein